MAFLEELDALPADQAQARMRLFYGHLRADWRSLFAELRDKRPVLDLPLFSVVSRWTDVLDTLSRPSDFQITYRPHMDPSVGPFMLARDDSELNWHDKSLMRALLRWDDLPAIRSLIARVAAEALVSDGDTIDVVASVSRLVPLRVVQQSFGFPGPDDESMLRWSRATQADMFHNLLNDPAVFDANIAAGTEMRTWIREFLSQREPWSQADGDDTVSRLLRLAGSGLAGFDTERVVSNVAGLLVGAIETASQAIVNATEQILLRPDIKARAIETAALDDPEEVDSIVWEALRFNPMTALVQRVAGRETVLAPSSDYAVTVPAGRVIAVGIGSAMFDPAMFADPDEFKARDRLTYLHMGFGHHICLGQYVGYAIIPETVRQIMRLPGIHLLEDGGSKVDDQGGPFAERFVVGVTPAPANA